MAAAPWATIADVLALTGKTIVALDRTMAVNAIELHTGFIEVVERVDMTDRDRYWLKLAVCYQAAWLLTQPDYLERNNVSSVSQDGQSTTGNPDWLTLAPLARKAIKRMSIKGPRTIVVGREERLGRLNVLSDAYDDSLPWERV